MNDADGPARTVVHAPDASRWELRHGDDVVGVVNYRPTAGHLDAALLDLLHVEVVAELRGQGVSAPFLDDVLAQIRAAGQKVVPYCGYAAGHLRSRPELHDLLA